jgi:hypothetical protein
MKHVLPLSVLLLAAAAPAAAQQRAVPFDAAPRLALAAPADTTWRPAGRREERIAVRALAGALGWAVGGLAGIRTGGGMDDCDNCEDPGLAGALAGGLVGAALGGGLGAAIPDYRGRCDFSDRFWRGALGGLAGTLLAAVVISGSDADEGGALLVLGAGGTLGAALSADC